jgi:hypothetical protein
MARRTRRNARRPVARTAAIVFLVRAATIGFAAAPAALPAWAGPPFVTDDPEPVDYRHFEINSAVQDSFQSGGQAGTLPGIDANYGLLPETQFHLGFGGAFARMGGTSAYGYGDTDIGLKYRFIDEDADGPRPQVAVYPNISFPTGDQKRGLGAGHVQTFLPVWLQKGIGPWTTFGGGGYWFNRGGNDKDYWFAGWALLRQVTDRLQLGGELFVQTASTVNGRSWSGFNLGGTYDFDDMNHLLFSAGRGITNASRYDRFSYYLGYQLTF